MAGNDASAGRRLQDKLEGSREIVEHELERQEAAATYTIKLVFEQSSRPENRCFVEFGDQGEHLIDPSQWHQRDDGFGNCFWTCGSCWAAPPERERHGAA